MKFRVCVHDNSQEGLSRRSQPFFGNRLLPVWMSKNTSNGFSGRKTNYGGIFFTRGSRRPLSFLLHAVFGLLVLLEIGSKFLEGSAPNSLGCMHAYPM